MNGIPFWLNTVTSYSLSSGFCEPKMCWCWYHSENINTEKNVFVLIHGKTGWKKNTPNEKQNAERFLKWSKIERLHWRKSTCWNWIECCVFYVCFFVSVFFFCCFSIKRMFYRVQMFFNLIKRVLLKCLFESFHFDACTASNKPLFSLFRYYFLSRGFNSDSNFFNVLQVFLMRVTDKEGTDWERET